MTLAPTSPAELDRHRPDARRAAVHEQRLAGLEVGDEEDVRPHRAHDLRQRRGVHQRHPRGHGQQLPGRHPRPARRTHHRRAGRRPRRRPTSPSTPSPSASTTPLTSSPGTSDSPAGGGVEALPLQQVGPVDARGHDPHQQLAGVAARAARPRTRTRASGPPNAGSVMAFMPPTYDHRAGRAPRRSGTIPRDAADRTPPYRRAAPAYGGCALLSDHRWEQPCRSNAAPSSREPPPSPGEPCSAARSRASSPRPAAALGAPAFRGLRATPDLRDGKVRLHLPEDFSYRSFHDTESPVTLDDGTVLPGAPRRHGRVRRRDEQDRGHPRPQPRGQRVRHAVRPDRGPHLRPQGPGWLHRHRRLAHRRGRRGLDRPQRHA